MIKRLTILALYAYLITFALLWFFRGPLIYRFDSSYETPLDAGEPRLSETWLKTPDGEDLLVWHAPSKAGKPTIVYFHGNAGGLSDRAQRFDRLLDRGYGILALAYRGSSGSTGQPSEVKITEDILTFRESFDLLAPNLNGPLVYYGESLGTAAAIKLATWYSPDGIVLEAPFRSMAELASDSLPMFPVRYVLDDVWNSVDHIKVVSAPLLILHGEKDAIIPIDHGVSVYEASAAETKQILKLPNGTHHNLWSVEAQSALYRFLDRL